MFAHFYEYHRNCEKKKKNESLYDFGGRCQEFRDISMDFEPYLKVHTLISVRHKSTKLLNVIFHVMVSNYRLVKI